MSKRPIPKILTVAGSDSGGGAGIQADLKTFLAHGCYGMSAITALTAQNTTGVFAVQEATPEMVAEQIDAVLGDIGCDAAKTGMLSSTPIIQTVAERLHAHHVRNLVVDPVMVAKSGHRLLADEAISALVEQLFPLATLVTPNLEEVGVILGHTPRNIEEMCSAARQLTKLGPYAALVKGGHLPDDQPADDVLWDGSQIYQFPAARLDAQHTHGTGCTLSAAIACNLGKGLTLDEAVGAAKLWLTNAIKTAFPVGHGIGPVNHMWRIVERVT